MFGKRTGFLAAAAAVFFSGSVLAQIPDAFTSGFDPKSIELEVKFGSKALTNGDTLTPADAAALPTFALGGSSGISPKTKYVILMIDPDSPSRDDVVVPQVLHYLKTDFSVSEFTDLASSSNPTLSYVGPSASVGTGPHRYIFLLYVQPDGFTVKGVPSESNRAGFNVSDWRVTNGLKAAVAGIHFVATPPGGGAVSSSVAAESKTAVAPPMMTGTSNGVVYTTTVPCTTASGTTKSVQSAMISSKPQLPATQTSALASAKTHTVIVGGPNSLLKYTPENVVANVGDVVYFDFREKNHTVTQSSFDNPCVFNTTGVKSGFRSNPDGIPGKEIFNFTVSDDKPKWFYCAQGTHCKSGMVFAINPGPKFPDFLNKAMGGANATATATATATGSTLSKAATATATSSTSTKVVTVCTVCSSASSRTAAGTQPPVLSGTATAPVPSGTLRPSAGFPIPSGNASAPSASGAPVFTGAGSTVTFSITALAGVFLAALLLV
ncbi:phosphatidylethanolamine-binding protein [Tuber borchii]|uniref:Phosphatidylethanolamine-binding protein n=1 Tax=Tuber borchii TaxID=42251 RepID=A0A2T7A7A1_TUBBO|nr:phosphatidylethanolamine-binding protein [Tuber borchii]